MNTQDLATVQADFLLVSTTPFLRNLMLIECAEKNDMTGLQKLITAEPAVVRRAGEDALAAACAKGHLDIVVRLHTIGVKVDGFFFDDNNPSVTITQYPLRCAFENNQWHVAQWLVDHGAKVMPVPRVLENMVGKTPALFALMLKELPYIKAYEAPVDEGLTFDVLTYTGALSAALDVIARNDCADYAALALHAGLSPHSMYDVAMAKHAYAILRDLYVSGYRPDADQMAAHMALIDAAPSSAGVQAEQVRALVQAWVHADNHLQLDPATKQGCVTALTHGYDSGAEIPAALVLTRGGAFASAVAQYLPQAGMDLLLLKDRHGATLLDALMVRGELAQVFDPAIWGGDFAKAAGLHAQLPNGARKLVDLAAVSARFGRYRVGAGHSRFKLPSAGKGN